MLAVKRGDVTAFETLFRKHARPLLGLARAFVHSQARAEEIVQETFYQVYKNRQRYEPQARFGTWLYRIATNLCLSEVRRAEYRWQANPSAYPDDEEQTDAMETIADATARTSEDEALAREEVRLVNKALQDLPGQQKAALLLARVEGFSYEEVARTLGCSVAAVKSLIHRATLGLRARFGSSAEK